MSIHYEVMHGDRTEFVQAGNQIQACLNVLGNEAQEGITVLGPFIVQNLLTNEEETIPMAEVVYYAQLSADCPPVHV